MLKIHHGEVKMLFTASVTVMFSKQYTFLWVYSDGPV